MGSVTVWGVPAEAKRSARYSIPFKTVAVELPAFTAYTNTSSSEIPPEFELEELELLELDELLEEVLEVDELLEPDELVELEELDELLDEEEPPPQPASAATINEVNNHGWMCFKSGENISTRFYVCHF